MDSKEFKQSVKNRLLQIQSSTETTSSDDQIQLKCQFCGDSKKDATKRRLYIKLNMYDDNLPILYNCFNCGASGILTPSILKTLKINDLNLSSNLMSFNKTTINKINKKIGITNNNFIFTVPRPKNTRSNRMKKEYIETRLGVSLTTQELIDMKIIFNFEQFIIENDIHVLNVKNSMANLLNDQYIGFLTAKNEFINFRDTTDNNKIRYYKYPIFSNIDNTRKFYTIPTSIDLLSNEEININIAEGIFDIFGVYYHIFDKNIKNNIYAAVCGSAYVNVIKYFIQLGIFGENININIFSDSDKQPYFYKGIIDELSLYVNSINLYYNDLYKDFGVSKDMIYLLNKKIKK